MWISERARSPGSREHPSDFSRPLWRDACSAGCPSKSRSWGYSNTLSRQGYFARCGLAGDQRWTKIHLAATPRGTAASARFGASSVVANRHRSPPPVLFVARDIFVISLSLSFSLSFFLPFSPSSPARTPASRRARLDPSSLLHPRIIILSRSPMLFVSRSLPHPALSVLSLCFSTSFPLQLVLVLVTYIPSPPTTPSTTSFLFVPLAPRLASHSRSRSTLGGPHPRIVGWRGTPCGTTCLPFLPSLVLSPPDLLPHDSSLSDIPLPPGAIVHPNIVGGERIVTMAINMIERRMPRYPYTWTPRHLAFSLPRLSLA